MADWLWRKNYGRLITTFCAYSHRTVLPLLTRESRFICDTALPRAAVTCIHLQSGKHPESFDIKGIAFAIQGGPCLMDPIFFIAIRRGRTVKELCVMAYTTFSPFAESAFGQFLVAAPPGCVSAPARPSASMRPSPLSPGDCKPCSMRHGKRTRGAIPNRPMDAGRWLEPCAFFHVPRAEESL